MESAAAAAAAGLPAHPLGSLGLLAAAVSGGKGAYRASTLELDNLRLEARVLASTTQVPEVQEALNAAVLQRVEALEARLERLERDIAARGASPPDSSEAAVVESVREASAEAQEVASRAAVVARGAANLAAGAAGILAGTIGAVGRMTRAAAAQTAAAEAQAQSVATETGTEAARSSSRASSAAAATARDAADAADAAAQEVERLSSDAARLSEQADAAEHEAEDAARDSVDALAGAVERESQHLRSRRGGNADGADAGSTDPAEQAVNIGEMWALNFGDVFREDVREFSFGDAPTTYKAAPETGPVSFFTDVKVAAIVRFAQDRASQDPTYQPLVAMWENFRDNVFGQKPGRVAGTVFDARNFGGLATPFVYIDYRHAYSVATGRGIDISGADDAWVGVSAADILAGRVEATLAGLVLS